MTTRVLTSPATSSMAVPIGMWGPASMSRRKDGTATRPTAGPATNPVRAAIHDNVSRNVQNGMYMAAAGFAIYQNQFQNAHGVTIRSSPGSLQSSAPIVVSPTSRDIDFHNENANPATRHWFESQSWIGCIPNWPF